MLTYEEVTPTKFSALQASLASHGLKVAGNAGVIKKLGAVVEYSYTPASQTLTVDVKHAPWTVKVEKFTAAIDDAIKSAIDPTGSGSSSGVNTATPNAGTPNTAAKIVPGELPSVAAAKEAQ